MLICTCTRAAVLRSSLRNNSRSLVVPAAGAATPTPKSAPLPLSSTPAGTVLKNLNILKGGADPVALDDAEYPAWLWKVLAAPNVKKSTGGGRKAAGAVEDDGVVMQREIKELRRAGKAAIKARNDLG